MTSEDKPSKDIKLSALDLSIVTTDTPPAKALRNSIDLAQHVDRLGYHRYWLAEHHSLPSVASPAPDVMIGQIAAVTQHLRVGSGGVMLPNHAPLAVAERFKMLEALFPGRIDLGLGRAPGTDQVTAYALRSRLDKRDGDDFLERFQELVLWDTRQFPPGHPFNKVLAMPVDTPLPPIWLLGSSDYSAQLAGQIGAGFAFAHHFSNYDAVAAMTDYRRIFEPSPFRQTPYAILGVAAIVAPTDEEADRLATTQDLFRLRRDKGEFAPLPSPEEAMAYPYSAAEKIRVMDNRDRLFVGSPETVMKRLMPLVEATKADEVMAVTAIFDHDARKRSYTLLAQAFDIKAQEEAGA